MDLVQQKIWFDSPEFQDEFHTDIPLGSFCTSEGTTFRLWAPTAESVTLFLYTEGAGSPSTDTIAMTSEKHGVWVHETDRNLDGMYYDYEVTVGRIPRKTADPYAKACGLNGNRSMVIDLRRTDPEGWEQDAAPARKADDVIYELHVKDFSWDPAGGFSPEDRGRYSALCRTGTTLNHDGLHSTGIDYLKQLGITHIQLLPIYDFGSVDEAGPLDRYNWGYDPVNYNIPEGIYSSDPFHGEVRIRELKEAIQSLHQNGFRVIMDVVYNHTYQLDSWLWRVAPWYFYRQHDDGSVADGSGCGSEIASERSMCARYILDSVLYWAEEFHMDGFRFDLMGLMDVDLMNRIQDTLDQRFGTGEKLLYGEPWGACGGSARPGTHLCTKDHLKALTPSIGAFCDNTRDAVKGSLMDVCACGFVNGSGISHSKLRQCITGWAEGDYATYQAPSQTISYLSCHDDWTLWDKLVYTMDPEQKFQDLRPDILRANRLAAAINFSCQGHTFIHAGEEFGRTKNGVKNSFRSDPWINQLDWRRAWDNRDLVDYYRGLIALRMQLPCLQDKSEQAAARVLSDIDLAYNCAGVSLRNAASGSTWDKILLIFNCNGDAQTIELPSGIWQILVNDISSFCWQDSKTVQESTTIPPVSALILGRISK